MVCVCVRVAQCACRCHNDEVGTGNDDTSVRDMNAHLIHLRALLSRLDLSYRLNTGA